MAAKLVYTLIAAGLGGWLAALVASPMARVAIFTLIAIQTAGLLWDGFVSEWAAAAPLWFWLTLIAVTATGLLFGYRIRAAKR